MSTHPNLKRSEQRAARALAKSEGISYQDAINRLRSTDADAVESAQHRRMPFWEQILHRVDLKGYMARDLDIHLDPYGMISMEGAESRVGVCPVCAKGSRTFVAYDDPMAYWTTWTCSGPCQGAGNLLDLVQLVRGLNGMEAALYLNELYDLGMAEDTPGPNTQEQADHVIAGIRRRPAMWVGGTGSVATHNMICHLVDNSVHEHVQGYGKEITVTLSPDGPCTVEDRGRGLPVERRDLERLCTGEAGPKGLPIVNALSSDTAVITHGPNGDCGLLFLTEGVPDTYEVVRETDDGHRTTGTRISFRPDTELLGSAAADWDLARLNARLRELSSLHPNLTIRLNTPSDAKIYAGGNLSDELPVRRLPEPGVVRLKHSVWGINIDCTIGWTEDGLDPRRDAVFVNTHRIAFQQFEREWVDTIMQAPTKAAKEMGVEFPYPKIAGSRMVLAVDLRGSGLTSDLRYAHAPEGRASRALADGIAGALMAWLTRAENREEARALLTRLGQF